MFVAGMYQEEASFGYTLTLDNNDADDGEQDVEHKGNAQTTDPTGHHDEALVRN